MEDNYRLTDHGLWKDIYHDICSEYDHQEPF